MEPSKSVFFAWTLESFADRLMPLFNDVAMRLGDEILTIHIKLTKQTVLKY